MAVTGLATVTYEAPRIVDLAPEVGLDGDGGALDAPEAIVVEHGEGAITRAGGPRLYTQWWRPCVPARGVVVVVHGLKDHGARYADTAERLGACGLAVHAFDLRGHGRSGGAREWVDRFDDYVDDLQAVVGRVRAFEGRLPLFVFGQGVGATVATLWALERRAPLAGLALSGAWLQATCAPAPARSTRLLATLAPRVRILQLDIRRISRDRGTVEDAVRDALVQRAPAPARTAAELLDAMARIDARAGELTVPLLAMHGSADTISDEQGSRRLIERAASADKQLYVYDGLAHDLMHEPERDRVRADLATWIVDRLGT